MNIRSVTGSSCFDHMARRGAHACARNNGDFGACVIAPSPEVPPCNLEGGQPPIGARYIYVGGECGGGSGGASGRPCDTVNSAHRGRVSAWSSLRTRKEEGAACEIAVTHAARAGDGPRKRKPAPCLERLSGSKVSRVEKGIIPHRRNGVAPRDRRVHARQGPHRVQR